VISIQNSLKRERYNLDNSALLNQEQEQNEEEEEEEEKEKEEQILRNRERMNIYQTLFQCLIKSLLFNSSNRFL